MASKGTVVMHQWKRTKKAKDKGGTGANVAILAGARALSHRLDGLLARNDEMAAISERATGLGGHANRQEVR